MHSNIRQLALALTVASSAFVAVDVMALDGTVAQNSQWNIQRAGSQETLRIVAYGDSIVAGYTSPTEISQRSSTHVAAEYAAVLWGQRIEVRRRAQSGAVASAIYNRIRNDRAFMQTANTVGVHVVMCGNDYLQARSAFAGQSGQCRLEGLAAALDNCLNFTEQAIDYVNENAGPNVKLKVIGNLYYPGFNADNVLTNCTSPVTGDRLNRRDDIFLSIIAQSNWETCTMAVENGWVCADNFAEFMAADFDSNGDGVIDSDSIRFIPGEPMRDYINRILAANEAGLLRDSNFKQHAQGASVGYLLSDDTHTTFVGPTAKTPGSTPGGNVNVFHATSQPYPDFKNPSWNLNGHDRMGHALATNYDLNVDLGPDVTLMACEAFDETVHFNDRVFFGPWPVSVDFGNGHSITTEVSGSDMSLPVFNEFNEPGLFTVNAVVTGAYGTVWHDSTLVSVLSVEEGVLKLMEDFADLAASTTVNRRWMVMTQGYLADALSAAQNEDVAALEQSLALFSQSLARGLANKADRDYLADLAARILVSTECAPVEPVSRARFKAYQPFTLPQREVVPQRPLPETHWVEFDGVKYDPNDPRLLELQLQWVEENLPKFLSGNRRR